VHTYISIHSQSLPTTALSPPFFAPACARLSHVRVRPQPDCHPARPASTAAGAGGAGRGRPCCRHDRGRGVRCWDAARRAVEAGYDAVQIHSAHGYLISEFNSPYANQRTDQWGGSPESRRRLLLEVYRRVRGAVGDDVPVFVKLNGEDFIEGGLTPEGSAEIAKVLEAEGIDAIEVSAGFAETADLIVRKDILEAEQEAYLLPLARNIRNAVSVPVMIVGGLRSREVMERMLNEEGMTFVSLSRPFIRQPDLANKLKAGELDGVTCVSCGRCTRNDQGWLACAVDEGSAS